MKTAKQKIVRKPKKKFQWSVELAKVEVSGALKALPEDRSAIAPVLSREMKIKYPDRVYRTDTKTEPGFLLVHRLS